MLAAKDVEVVTITAEWIKLKTVKADLDKVKKDLQSANVLNKANQLNLKYKDVELHKVSEELRGAKDREANVFAKYQKSMDFVTRLANRCNWYWWGEGGTCPWSSGVQNPS